MMECELTSLMYKLLSPSRNNELGRLYLELFDKHVLRLEMSAEELDSAKILIEYPTQRIKRRRLIDLVIVTARRFIPIEVKVDAVDRNDQCYDYWCEAAKYTTGNNFDEQPVLYYLTPTGHFPDKHSANDLTCAEIDTISFRVEIRRWLEDCLKHTPEDFPCRQNLLFLSKKVSLLRGKIYPQLEDIMRNFFTALDERFDEIFCERHHLKRGSNRRGEVGDFQNYRREIDKFYGEAFSAPGITFTCTDATGNIIKLGRKKELWFRVECCNDSLRGGRKLCAGFMIFNHGTKNFLRETMTIKRLLDGKNILKQSLVDGYGKNFGGLIGRKILLDEQGNAIDFKYLKHISETWEHWNNRVNLSIAVAHIMAESESLFDNFNRHL